MTSRMLPEGDWGVGLDRSRPQHPLPSTVRGTNYIDSDYSDEWRETLCGWLEARGISPLFVYRMRATRRWVHLYMYQSDSDGDKFVVERWGRRDVARMRMKVRNG